MLSFSSYFALAGWRKTHPIYILRKSGANKVLSALVSGIHQFGGDIRRLRARLSSGNELAMLSCTGWNTTTSGIFAGRLICLQEDLQRPFYGRPLEFAPMQLLLDLSLRGPLPIRPHRIRSIVRL
ncbi:unnamed protein product, partial [Symbiodinium necroappetens]